MGGWAWAGCGLPLTLTLTYFVLMLWKELRCHCQSNCYNKVVLLCFLCCDIRRSVSWWTIGLLTNCRFFSWSHLLLDFRTAVEFTARPIWASFVTHYILMLLTSFVVRPLCLSTSDSCVTGLQKLVNCHEGNLPFPVLSSTPLPASSLPFPLSFLSLSPFPLSPPTIPTSDSCVTGLLTLVNCHEGHLPFPVLSSTPLPASSLPFPLSFQLWVWAAWRGSVSRSGSFNVIRLDLHTWILDILM